MPEKLPLLGEVMEEEEEEEHEASSTEDQGSWVVPRGHDGNETTWNDAFGYSAMQRSAGATPTRAASSRDKYEKVRPPARRGMRNGADW